MVLLVVFHHSAITYGASGGWFYREVETNMDDLQSLAMSLFCAVNQSFFMGLLFLLAGYFTPGSIDRKGPRRFIVDRLIRLGIPLIIFGFVLGPITIAMAASANGGSFWDTLLSRWGAVDFEWGPLWFVWALLLFSLAALVWRQTVNKTWRAAFPTNRFLLLSAIAIGIIAFCLRLIWPLGWAITGLQLGFFASYIFLFAAGFLAAERHLLEVVPAASTAFWKKAALIAFPILPVVALGVGFVPGLAGPPEGGLNIVAFTYAMWEPFMAFGIILFLLPWSLERFPSLGDINTKLSRRAYTIFIIHAPVLVGCSILSSGIGLPPILKFICIAAATCAICYFVAGLLLRIPPVRRVL